MCVCVLDFSVVCINFVFCAWGIFSVRRCITILLHYKSAQVYFSNNLKSESRWIAITLGKEWSYLLFTQCSDWPRLEVSQSKFHFSDTPKKGRLLHEPRFEPATS